MSTKAIASPDVVRQIGEITRKLHDAIEQLGLMPDLQAAAQALPDARSRLNYIAVKTSDAANRVLNSVDAAKLDHLRISTDTTAMKAALSASTGQPAPEMERLRGLVESVQVSSERIDEHLTNIMLAQDFHDLTSQIITKVVRMTDDLEQQLVNLLMDVAPEDAAARTAADRDALHGPVVDPATRADVVCDQNEVDDLLARMGF